jgi:hypothetical protein
MTMASASLRWFKRAALILQIYEPGQPVWAGSAWPGDEFLPAKMHKDIEPIVRRRVLKVWKIKLAPIFLR